MEHEREEVGATVSRRLQKSSSVGITPDGRLGLLARRNQPFAEIDLATGKETGRWKEAVAEINSMAYSPDSTNS